MWGLWTYQREKGNSGLIVKAGYINLGGSRVAKWEKAGIVKLSRSMKVILVAVWGLDSKKWLIIDVENLLDVIAGKKQETDLLEPRGV
jgi:hypothetical protein